jgi:hypothetical protein
MSKKLQQKQQKRLAEQMRREQQKKAARRSNFITIAIAVAIVGAVTAFIITSRNAGDVPPAPEGVAADQAGCGEIRTFEEVSRRHVPDGTEFNPDDYNSNPPTSGPHWETPAEADFYPAEISPIQALHNLEHGQIVIWYSPDASGQTLDDLRAFVDAASDVGSNEVPPMLAAPYDVPEGSYVLTAWTALQTCERYSKEAIDDFRTRYQGRGPEQVGVPTL